jgi:hypothetical protein
MKNLVGRYAIIKKDVMFHGQAEGLKVRICNANEKHSYCGCDFSEVENLEDFEFKKRHRLHDCDGHCQFGYGLNILIDCLEIIDDNPIKKFFKVHPLEK